MNKSTTLFAKGSVFAFALLMVSGFSGCDWFGGKKSSTPAVTTASKGDGMVLCTIDGEAAIKESDFVNNLSQMIQSNPYFRGATIDTLPKELLRKFLDQLCTQELIVKYAMKHNIEKDPEFIKAYNETEKLLKRSLMVQIYEKQIYDNIKVDDADIQKHYAENKDRFVKVAGGVLCAGARFESETDADAFLNKVKSNMDGFESAAKADKHGKFKDFGRVSREAKPQQQAMQFDAVPGPVKEGVLSMSKLPGVEMVKAGKEYWVIKAWDKKDTVLFDLSEIKPHVESMLKNNRYRDELDKRLKDLKGQFKMVVNEDFFKEKSTDGGKGAEGNGSDDDDKDDDDKGGAPKNQPASAA